MYISHQAITFISFSNPLLADSDVIFGIGFFGNLGEGRKQSQLVSSGQCFHGVSCKAILSALET